MTKEGSTKIVNFLSPGAGVLALGRGHISHIHVVKMHYFFKKSSSLLPGKDQTNYLVYSNDDQGRVYQNCKFYYPPGVLILGMAILVIIVNMYYLLIYQYTAH